MSNYLFTVPQQKKVRMIVHTDCKNEADDQYALAHHLMTPKFDVVGIIAGHFETFQNRYPKGETAKASYDEIQKVMHLMHMENHCPVALGASEVMTSADVPVDSEGAQLIIEEAMKDDPRPLFIAMQGAVTDLAAAILMKPEICSRMTAIWIGGGIYPEGGWEFNMMQDPIASNILFRSQMPLWQVPMNVYKQMSVSLAELQLKVRPYGEIGKYLFEQMVEFNLQNANNAHWPHGEIWGLGDQGTISVMMEESEKTDIYKEIEAPGIDERTGCYHYGEHNRKIRVYHTLNTRLTLEDFFCKLQINYPKQDS